MSRNALPSLTAIATGVLFGIAVGVLLPFGNVWAASAIILLLATTIATVRVISPAEHRVGLLRLALLVFALRLAAVAIVHGVSIASGNDGFVSGDDAAYATASWKLIQYLQGEVGAVEVGQYSYLFGTWVYVGAVLFWFFGPDVLLPKVVNVGLSTWLVVIMFDIGKRLFGARAGFVTAALVGCYPSLVLWSSVNLKDTSVLLLTALCFWGLLRFQASSRPFDLALTYAPLVLLGGLRRFVFVGMAVLLVGAMAIVPWARTERMRWTGLAAFLSIVLLLSESFFGARSLVPPSLTSFEVQRYYMSLGARTGFQETIPVRVGDTFVVPPPPEATPTAWPPPAASPATTSQVVHVAPGSRLLVVQSGASVEPARQQNVVYVRPGDVVVVGPANTTPALPEHQRTLRLPQSGPVRLEGVDEESALARTIAYAPRGAIYVLFAPFPWSAGRPLDLVTVPEMLLWYVLLAAAVYTVWWRRREWRTLGPIVAFVVGILVVLILAEGNVGTVFRHRSMMVPFIILLAVPALHRLLGAASALRVRRSSRRA